MCSPRNSLKAFTDCVSWVLAGNFTGTCVPGIAPSAVLNAAHVASLLGHLAWHPWAPAHAVRSSRSAGVGMRISFILSRSACCCADRDVDEAKLRVFQGID